MGRISINMKLLLLKGVKIIVLIIITQRWGRLGNYIQ